MPKPGFIVHASEPLIIKRPGRLAFTAGIAALDVECSACRHRWRSVASPFGFGGSFVEGHATVEISCPRCGAAGEIAKTL